MAKQHSVEPGHRYRETGSAYLGKAPRVWVIEETFVNAVDGLAYVRLSAENDPYTRKTVSVAVIADRRRFKPIGST